MLRRQVSVAISGNVERAAHPVLRLAAAKTTPAPPCGGTITGPAASMWSPRSADCAHVSLPVLRPSSHPRRHHARPPVRRGPSSLLHRLGPRTGSHGAGVRTRRVRPGSDRLPSGARVRDRQRRSPGGLITRPPPTLAPSVDPEKQTRSKRFASAVRVLEYSHRQARRRPPRLPTEHTAPWGPPRGISFPGGPGQVCKDRRRIAHISDACGDRAGVLVRARVDVGDPVGGAAQVVPLVPAARAGQALDPMPS